MFHCACSNADLNLTLVTGTASGFIFQIISSLIKSLEVRLTCLHCKKNSCVVQNQEKDTVNTIRWILLIEQHYAPLGAKDNDDDEF